MRSTAFVAAWITLASACATTDESPVDAPVAKDDATYKAELTTAVHAVVMTDIREFVSATHEVCERAPVVTGRGWVLPDDEEALSAMRSQWLRARGAYERIEGAVAQLFPELDRLLDARYDETLAELGPVGDPNAFDATGVIGMHAVERVLFAHAIPQRVVDVERAIPGYVVARFPTSELEALAFRAELCAALAADARALEATWSPEYIDVDRTFSGLVNLMIEQRDKLLHASSSEEESRYAQTSLSDLRANLAGTRAVYEAFRPWLQSRPNGSSVDTRVVSGFERLAAVYAGYLGDAIPAAPVSWSSENPSIADRATPFGILWTNVRATVDPGRNGSLIEAMNDVANTLGLTPAMRR